MKDQKALDLVQAKGDLKANPWTENESMETVDVSLKQSTSQAVQNLPPVLAQDSILKAILMPSLKQIEFGDFPNVVPLKINYGGSKTEQTSKGDIVSTKAHKDKLVEYDKTKGFVTTSWANFIADPNKQQRLTTNKEGLFIKHVTSTVINPNNMFKGKDNQPLVNMESLSFTNGNLLSNSWTNVLLYTPKEQVFKIDVPKGTFAAFEEGKGGQSDQKKD